jgi:hypothetical protein
VPLAAGYKNLVGARRASWRILQSVEQSEIAKGNEKRVKLIQKYRTVVEKELDDICGEILELLDKHLIPSASTCEASVFYLKMKADYLRYLSEFKTDADRKEAADKTLVAYNAAQDKALAELPSTNPIRLGLALNFSVFYYEVMNQPEKACNLAKQVRTCAAGRGPEGAAVCLHAHAHARACAGGLARVCAGLGLQVCWHGSGPWQGGSGRCLAQLGHRRGPARVRRWLQRQSTHMAPRYALPCCAGV